MAGWILAVLQVRLAVILLYGAQWRSVSLKIAFKGDLGGAHGTFLIYLRNLIAII
jgi:hypothetical protein